MIYLIFLILIIIAWEAYKQEKLRFWQEDRYERWKSTWEKPEELRKKELQQEEESQKKKDL
jgi:hypothetical protein